MKEIAVNIIKEELKKREIKVVKILLFGSRARGDIMKKNKMILVI